MYLSGLRPAIHQLANRVNPPNCPMHGNRTYLRIGEFSYGSRSVAVHMELELQPGSFVSVRWPVASRYFAPLAPSMQQ